MKPIEGNIIVQVELSQNEERADGFKTGRKYNENFRERNPAIALVLRGTKKIPTGSSIICNYNYFVNESPLLIAKDIFSIPVNEEIFAIVHHDGSLSPVCGNVFVERLTHETIIDLPEELKKPHTNQGIISMDAEGYKKGQYIFWLKMADYEIVYNWKGMERRAIKVHKSEITGYLKK